MKKLIPTLVTAVAMFAAAITSAQAQGASFSANGTITNNYMWRGITQSNDDFALQLGADVEFENGLSFGAWGSNVDWGAGDIELDLYGGYSFALTDMLSASVGGIVYLYPDKPSGVDANFFEVNGGLEVDLDPITLGGSIAFSPDVAGETTWNFEGSAAIGFAEYFEVFGNLGYYEWEVTDGWLYYIAGVGASYENFGVALYATGTDISGDDTEFVAAFTITIP